MRSLSGNAAIGGRRSHAQMPLPRVPTVTPAIIEVAACPGNLISALEEHREQAQRHYTFTDEDRKRSEPSCAHANRRARLEDYCAVFPVNNGSMNSAHCRGRTPQSKPKNADADREHSTRAWFWQAHGLQPRFLSCATKRSTSRFHAKQKSRAA